MSAKSTRPAARNGASVKGVNYASSPLLAEKTPPWRSRFIVVLIGLGFLALLGRAVYIQISGKDFFLEQGEKRYVHNLEISDNRGRILDRNGLILATRVPTASLWAIPKDFEASAEQKRALAKLLGVGVKDLDARLASGSANFAWIRRHVDEDVWKQIQALKIAGLYSEREYRRRYPEGEAAAHVVGFTGLEDHGQEGIELGFDKELVGRDGSREVVKDRLGRVVEDIGERVDPVNGRDITLAIDSKVQFFAYQRVRDAVEQHKAKSGSVVVVDAQTGEVLAMANYPSYNPGELKGSTLAQRRNLAVTDIFEPGSTMKPLVVSLALETGRARLGEVINTAPGSLVVGPLVVRDSHSHPALTVQEVIQKSSNIGAARIALRMQPRELWELFSTVGYGQKPQLNYPGVANGRLKPYKVWKPIEQATMAYGYGLSASLLQMARAYTVFAREGDVIPVSLVKQDTPATGVKVFSPNTVHEMRQMLQAAAAPGGTAPKAMTAGYSVGGKSGTAHRNLEGGKGYASDRYRSWFVGIAPISQPRIIVAVMLDDPRNGQYFGGDVAAPVFSQVVQQTLRMMAVPPDIDVKPQIVANQLPAEKESF